MLPCHLYRFLVYTDFITLTIESTWLKVEATWFSGVKHGPPPPLCWGEYNFESKNIPTFNFMTRKCIFQSPEHHKFENYTVHTGTYWFDRKFNKHFWEKNALRIYRNMRG